MTSSGIFPSSTIPTSDPWKTLSSMTSYHSPSFLCPRDPLCYLVSEPSLLTADRYNLRNVGTEGGLPSVHPAFASGQDLFLASLDSKGIMNETYYQALSFTQSSSRTGIDGALSYTFPNGTKKQLDALLVPSDVGQTYQAAAQAGYPQVTIPAGTNTQTGMPFGLGIMGTAWSETSLVEWASAIEDLQRWSGKGGGRAMPRWWGYRERNIPVLNL